MRVKKWLSNMIINFLKKLWKNEFYKGGIFITLSSFIINFLNYLFNFIVGRTLGPNDYGEIASLFSYINIFSIPILILSTLVVQKLSSKDDQRFEYSQILEIWFLEKLKKYWFIWILCLLVIPFLPNLTNLARITAFSLIPMIILAFIGSFYLASLQGLRLFFFYSLIGVIITSLKFVGAILTTISANGLFTIILFIAISYIFLLVGSYIAFHRNITKTNFLKLPKIEKRLIHIIIDPYFILISISTLAIILFNNFDIIFVKKFFSSADAGIYSSWTLFAKMISYLIGPLITVTFVFFTSNQNTDIQNKTLTLSLFFLSIVGVTSFIFYRLFGSFLIRILFGNKFDAVIPYLSYASIFGSLYCIVVFINGYFAAKKSPFTLMLPIFIPFYILILFLSPKNIPSIIRIDIFFSLIVAIIYLIVYIKMKTLPKS